MSRTAKHIVRRALPSERPNFPAECPDLLQRLYAVRGIKDAADLDLNLKQLLPPASMKGMSVAIERLALAVRENQSILIVGDFDADGATSSAVAIRALTAMGAQQVDYLVPNRFEFGYGLTPEIVDIAALSEPNLLITVDNGIASHAGVQAANEKGIDVIITDHHLAGRELPEAQAILNPNQPGCEFASKHLAGVGVIFYLMLGLRAYLREKGWFENGSLGEPNLAELLDLVALGTVADVVTLDYNNRILVQQGLQRIRAGRACVGIQALLAIAGREHQRIVSADLGFALGPRLNAAGRLDDMSIGIECLLSEDYHHALGLAEQLNQLNQERKEIEADMQSQALAMLEDFDPLADSEAKDGLCLFNPAWHQGVVGLLAGRIKDRIHRPVIAFAKVDEKILKGSARSIPGIHIRDVLDELATSAPHLLSKFGGHAMAAGLSIEAEVFEEFSDLFNQVVARHLTAENQVAQLLTDGELEPDCFNLGMAQQLRMAGPWGQGFPEPLFDGEFFVVSERILAGKHLKLVLKPISPAPQSITPEVEAIIFFADLEAWSAQAKQVRLVYKLDVNLYRDIERLQLVGEHFEVLA